jgi:hypothetical protein
LNSAPLGNFEQASRAVLEHLYQRFGFALWMVTRTDGDDWNILFTEDHGYDIAEGSTFPWSNSFCMRMVAGQGPRFAPRTREVPAYVAAEIGTQIDIGAYIGIPLTRSDGSVYGTLCAIDPVEHAGLSDTDRELVELMARMLSTILRDELAVIEQARGQHRDGSMVERDPETELLSHAAWHRVLATEEARARHFGAPACVLAVELAAEPPAEQARQVAAWLAQVTRETDFAARTSEHAFAVLMVECDAQGGARLAARLQAEAADSSIPARIGWAAREPDTGLEAAWQRASEQANAEGV